MKEEDEPLTTDDRNPVRRTLTGTKPPTRADMLKGMLETIEVLKAKVKHLNDIEPHLANFDRARLLNPDGTLKPWSEISKEDTACFDVYFKKVTTTTRNGKTTTRFSFMSKAKALREAPQLEKLIRSLEKSVRRHQPDTDSGAE